MVERDSRVFLEDLRSQVTQRLALAVMVACSLLLWLSLIERPFPLGKFVLLAALVGLGALTHALLTSSPVIARHALLWGLCAGLAAGMYLLPDVWLPFIGLPLAFTGALLVTGGAVATAGVICAAALWLTSSLGRSYPVEGLLATMAIGVSVAWLTVRTLYTALEWAYNMEQRADMLLEAARDRQGELNRVLKSLDVANALLRRTQGELVSARRRAEEAQLMKEQFAANVSHELRTPLNLILGFSEMMYLSPDVFGNMQWPPKLRRAVHQIYQNSRHLLQMIDDILDLSRFEIAGYTLNREPTPVSALVREAVDIVRGLFQESPVRLDLELAPDLPTLMIDRTRIRQVLLNLLSNAHRFTERGVVRVAATHQDHEVIISVSDTGPGIPAEKLSHIFKEFYQVDGSPRRKHGGAGLGLAISKHFVEAHGGRIWVESSEGAGSTFSFSLPLVADQTWSAEPAVRQTDESPSQPAQPVVLVVDRDPSLASLVRRHLADAAVMRVDSPEEVPDQVKLHHPTAVVYNRPPEDSRAQALSLSLPVPVIECSLPSQDWLASKLAVAACLTKPVTAEQLRHEIDRLNDVHDILVVDDERGFCQLVETMLAAAGRGFRVRRAYGGREGLRAMEARRPDLLLLDLLMPEVDGFQVLVEMQAQPELRDVPVVLLTATSFIEDALAQRSKQVVVHRSDGLRPGEVLNCLHALVRVLQPHYDEAAVPAEALATRDV